MCPKDVFVSARLLVTLVRSDQQSRTVRFLHVAFGTTGDSFLAGDHRGNIYMVDVGRNRCDCGHNDRGLLARPDLLLSRLICLWADFVWCREQDRPALLWPSISAEAQNSLWPWLITP